jgi:transcriptional regulator with XRE-family HTH domain
MSTPDAESLNLGERIRKAREEVGISMRELARRAGTTSSTITRIENNEVVPRADSLQGICDALNIPATFLWVSDDKDVLRKTLDAIFRDLSVHAIDAMEARVRFIERRFKIKTSEIYRPIFYFGTMDRVLVFDEQWMSPVSGKHLYVIFELGDSAEGWIFPEEITPAITERDQDQPGPELKMSWPDMESFRNFLKEKGFCWRYYPPARLHFEEYCQE